MRNLKKLSTTFALLSCLFTTSCNTAQIGRALSIASTIPSIIVTLPAWPQKEQAITFSNEIIHDIQIFKDNPTSGNLQNTLNAIDHALQSGIFGNRQSLIAVFQALRVLLAAIVPISAQSVGTDARVDVKDISKADVDALQRQVEALKKEMGR